METIKQQFTELFLVAIKEKSPIKLSQLCLTYDNLRNMEVPDINLTKKNHDAIVLKNCSTFFSSLDINLDEFEFKRITVANLSDEHIFKSGSKVQFTDNVSLEFAKKISNENLTIDIAHPMILNSEIKINNPLMIEVDIYEDIQEPISDANEYIFKVNGIEKKLPLCSIDRVNQILKENGVSDAYWGDWDWYLYEGDLEVHKLRPEYNLIVTGNLTVKEPMLRLEAGIMVLGETRANAIYIEEGSDVFLLGGTLFNTALLIPYSGAQIVVNRPKGPLLYNGCNEYDVVENIEDVKCYVEVAKPIPDCLTRLVLKEYIDEDEYEPFECDAFAIDIEIGKMVFESEDYFDSVVESIIPSLDTPEEAIELIKENPYLFKNLDKKFYSNKAMIEIAVDAHEHLFELVDEKLQNDREYILESIKRNSRLLQYVKDEFKNDKEIVLEAIKQRYYALRYASKRLQDNKEVLLFAINKSPKSLEFASKRLKGDKEVLLEVIKKDLDALKYATPSIINDEELMLEVIIREPEYIALENFKKYQNSKNFILKALKQNTLVYKYLNKNMQRDKDIQALTP